MKKLLSILGATSLVVSAPLSVVACKKKVNPNIDDEFDYDKLMRDFIDNITIIFNTEIQNQFSDYNFISEDELPDNLSYLEIVENQDQFQKGNKGGNVYNKVMDWVSSLIPIEQINSSIQNEISSDINYKPILIDSGSPLKSGIFAEEIDLLVQKDAITISSKISSSISLKGKNQEIINEPISTVVSINVFEDNGDNLLEQAKELEENYKKLINSKNANYFRFSSDSGNLSQTALEIEDNQIIINNLKEQIQTLSTDEVLINEKNLQLEVINNSIINAAGSAKSNTEYFSGEYRFGFFPTFIKAIRGVDEAEKTLLENIKGNDPEWIDYSTPILYKEMNEKIKQGAQISRWVNQYALIKNSKKTGFKNLLFNSKSEFSIDKEKDANTLAVFGTKISGIKFQLRDSEFILDDKYIFIRQEITRKNTLEYYNDFIEQAWEFHKVFLDPFLKPDGATIFNIQTPKTWKKEDFVGKTFNARDFPTNDILYANSEANAINSDFNFSLKAVQWENSRLMKFDEIYINKVGELFCYNTSQSKTHFTKVNFLVLNVSLFGDIDSNLYQPFLDFYNYNDGTSKIEKSQKEEIMDVIGAVFTLKFSQ
ncbi:lipoprotein [Spiroplasma alleghenense]|uniref:Lipoprotein n=1 Tax=Spiroplasma alleghenense TaxID=216931 RepID=A0A345Z581_9MOLU|nr:lipoprotein [Spiroplasma alleghenense]AXK51760.1 hypothetical protein SALLE_v1c10900 [Spiroplasma alleghenense]